MIKVFTVNENGKIEFTKTELEKLLDDIYAEGQKNCKCNNTITWTSPYINTTPYNGEILCNNSCENSNTNADHSSTNPTITMKRLSEQDRKRIDDVFNGLIKELDF